MKNTRSQRKRACIRISFADGANLPKIAPVRIRAVCNVRYSVYINTPFSTRIVFTYTDNPWAAGKIYAQIITRNRNRKTMVCLACWVSLKPLMASQLCIKYTLCSGSTSDIGVMRCLLQKMCCGYSNCY